ncbi:TPA: MBL fold metallo-hydrolase, partial [Candidatus Latescibacteria bacterium]|nr:MBL fold metallo-hydrolase [Candidatus Latescibacterota bacterium]
MALPQIIIGNIKVTALSAGRVRMDGGAMFGVVPKGLWARKIEADDRNRIDLQMRCLLVEAGEETLLVETGFGGKVNDRLREIY